MLPPDPVRDRERFAASGSANGGPRLSALSGRLCRQRVMTCQTTDKPSLTASDSAGRANSRPSALAANGTPMRGSQFTYVAAGTGPAYESPIDKITFLITGE